MDLQWDRLGEALQARRMAMKPRPTQEQAAKALGVSRTLIQNIERGKPFEKVTPSIREYARYVGWADGSVDRVLAGGDPTLVGEPAPSVPEIPGLPGRVQYELRQDGDLVDTVVIRLPGGGSAVVIVKDQPGATPEQQQQNLEAWLQTQSRLQALDYSETEPAQADHKNS
ncbi:helix-turn-helix domain-containing protein [Streptomyces sp. HNM0645]|uniref:helix-turn-helix domain-containing protein n=1 Tax=Streptomyces sp. HNM0645 TaxID=2782343 RepID=UPI0024B71B2D|nr:helix-turn-helix domain-containing protein [Streptomyces sp. HNM0645]MDI9887309.1 helix-turn-helix domain-containing protein [Streptomyces sp. HNM0645]